METVECGAVSLAMILASYGRWVSMDEMRYACGVSRSGTSARDLQLAGRMFGLELKGMNMSIEALHSLREPCIIYVDMSHFIVFRGFVGGFVKANDPATGLVYIDRNEFSRRYSGIALLCKPVSGFVKGGSRANSLYFIRRSMSGAKEHFFFTFITSLLLTVVTISVPVATQAFTDGVLTGENPEWGKPMIITLTLLALFQFIVNSLSAFYGMKLNARTQICASSTFIWHLLRTPVLFFSSRMPGDILLRIKNIANISVTLTTKLAPVAVNLSLLIFYGIFMYRYIALLATIVLIATILVILRVFVLSVFQMNIVRRSEVKDGVLQSDIMSSVDSIETIKAAGAEEGAFQKWASSFTAAANAKIQLNKFSEYTNTFSNLLIKIAGILVLIVGCSVILDGCLTIGMLMAFQGFTTSFTTPVTDVVNLLMTFAGMRSKMERAEDLYRNRTDVKSVTVAYRDKEIGGKLRGEVELRNVSYGFSAIHEPVVNDFSFHLDAGKSVAIVGPSGSGKSTVANIIAGIYKPWSGDVLFDGKPLGEIERAVFTDSVAIVRQDSSFFSGTLSDNLKLWDESISDEMMIQACKDTLIHNEIILRNGKYQCHLDSGGANFSGGQCQRMELASALARKPSILVLDEATSALDAITEAQIMDSIKKLNISLIVIAHRLSTIRDCDEIIVLERGFAVERGTHDELIELGGIYSKLVRDNG